MTPEQAALIDRIRARLRDEPSVREVSMFGGRAVMVNEKMIVSAGKDGVLLVRVDAQQHDELLTRPGASQAEMGPGRDMGAGWIEVAGRTVAADGSLDAWVQIALDYNRQATGGRS